ncbi:hypothetical protein GCM10010329_22950 [Streptomyces spiroverticillatus]|uniref:PH domain-containing protein n=1 Tax=Streptomyces finlayi TaxID=67296 RepID=A0A919C8W4_9ACTN|nr:hypothetical protein GCM10010329_22950 [Streptomyces spiroverticillatus]GHC84978.1 hypothetical protein GCM10010334_15370 [Streptomyces finlayi]
MWALVVLGLAGVVVWLLPLPEAERVAFGVFGAVPDGVVYRGSYVPMRESHVLVSTYAGEFTGDGSWSFGTLWAWVLPTVFQGLVLLEAYWIWRRPALALGVLAPLTAAALFLDEGMADTVPAARIMVGAVAVLVGLHLLHRVRARSRQRALVVEAAGAERHPVPDVPVRGRPWLVPGAGAVLLAVAVYVWASDWWAAESKWVFLVAGTLGTGLLVHALAEWRAAVRLRRSPQPVLRVLVREDVDGRTLVYAADDTAGAEPLLGFRGRGGYAGGSAGRPEGLGPRPLREAVLYGIPASGSELVCVGAVDGPEGRVEVVRGAAGRPERTTRTRRVERDNSTVENVASGSGVRQWAAGTVGRGLGVFFLVMSAGAVFNLLTGEMSLSWWMAVVSLPFWLTAAATALNWRVTADRSGVWVAGAWRVKLVRWEEIEKVDTANDSFVLRGGEGEGVALRPTGWTRLDHRTAAGHTAGHAAEAVRAMLADPGLRPTRESTTAEQGMPLGPVLVAGVLALGACVYWLF